MNNNFHPPSLKWFHDGGVDLQTKFLALGNGWRAAGKSWEKLAIISGNDTTSSSPRDGSASCIDGWQNIIPRAADIPVPIIPLETGIFGRASTSRHIIDSPARGDL
jgi:hypothetical protein